jgi:hypothetical protein
METGKSRQRDDDHRAGLTLGGGKTVYSSQLLEGEIDWDWSDYSILYCNNSGYARGSLATSAEKYAEWKWNGDNPHKYIEKKALDQTWRNGNLLPFSSSFHYHYSFRVSK